MNEEELLKLIEHFHISFSEKKFALIFFGFLIQYEQNLIRERIMAGLESAKRRGRIGGKPKLITESMVEEIKERLKKGESKVSIQRSTGIKHSTFYWTLKNRL